MNATRNPEGIMQVSRAARYIMFGLTAGWLIVGLAVASLPVGSIWSDSLARYPGAERLAATHFRLDTLPTGTISQQSAYQTADDLPQVLGWYAQHFGLGHEEPQGDYCITMTRVDARLFLQHSLAVTLCSDSKHTLVFVNRSLAVHW